jgi:hypothetical protein
VKRERERESRFGHHIEKRKNINFFVCPRGRGRPEKSEKKKEGEKVRKRDSVENTNSRCVQEVG